MSLRPINQKLAVSVVYAGAMFIAVMDMTIVNVALPTIARDFHTTIDSVATTVIAYQVSLAVAIPTAAWLGARFGQRQVLLASIFVFTVASGLCGIAGSLPELVAFRILQGLGGGLMTPVGLTMLFGVFPPAERVRASAILVIPTALAPAVGPIIGGFFVTDLSWRWVFYVNVPIGVTAVVLGLIFLVDQRTTPASRFDRLGFVTAGLGLGLLMYGVSVGPDVGWLDPTVLVGIAAGSALLVAMVRIELRVEHPLLDLRVFGDALFRAASLVLTVVSVSFFGLLYLLALFLQNGLGLDPFHAGLTIFWEAVGVIFASQFIQRVLFPAFGPRRIMISGLLIIAAVTVVLAQVDTGTNVWWIRLVIFLLGFGVAGVFLPSQPTAFATLDAARTAAGSTIFNAQRQLGGAVGVAALTAVISALHPIHIVDGQAVANIHAFHVGLLVCGAIALVGIVAALSIDDDTAMATMGQTRAAARPVPVDDGTLDTADSPA